jgi:predicted phosphodiesterase
VHYPHYAQALACTGDYDLVCCGHDHKSSISQVATVRGGHTWLINPGTVGGVGAPPTYIMAHLASMQFEVVTIDAAPASVLPPVTPHV